MTCKPVVLWLSLILNILNDNTCNAELDHHVHDHHLHHAAISTMPPCHDLHDHDHSYNFEESTIILESPCGDWTIYTNEKCIKIFDEGLSTWKEAELQCRLVHKSHHSQLVKVTSRNEQKFLAQFLFEEKKIVDNVWLGLKGSDNELKWLDETRLRYSNFAEKGDAPIPQRDCAQMTVGYGALATGLWTWAPCNKSNVVVCEKFHDWSLQTLQQKYLYAKMADDEAMTELKKETELLKKQQTDATMMLMKEIEMLKKTQTAIPVGYIYIQLSFQRPPTDLWPDTTWNDISTDYAGLFFRVTGGQSAGLGLIQEENSPRLTSAKYEKGYDGNPISISANGGWSPRIYSGSDKGEHWGIRFIVSKGEVRPRNQAVRVWQRMK